MKKIGLIIINFCLEININAQDSLTYSLVNDLIKAQNYSQDSF